MVIVDFTGEHVRAAAALARESYEEERRWVPDLPDLDAPLDLKPFAENGLGSAALEGGELVGFLCAVPPFEQVFGSTDVRGVFSPMGANAFPREGRVETAAALYRHAARKWVRAGAVSHGLCLYAHDESAQRQFFQYGFGMRCVDAVRSLDPVDGPPCEGYEFSELPPEECLRAYPLELLLHQHYLQSPFFMAREPAPEEAFSRAFREEGDRCFLAWFEGRPCAYLRLSAEGETCISETPGYRHITGAFCLPGHRGAGVFPRLLDTAVRTLNSEGFVRLGVDYESINPPAYKFWAKHFSPYTNGLVRRIDERILHHT